MNNLLLKPTDKGSVVTQTAFGVLLLALLLIGLPVSAETSAEMVVEEIAYDDSVEDAGTSFSGADGAEDAAISVEPIEPLSVAELGELVGPIALYPDDLIAIVLPASTYPLQIVQAVRFLEARKDDESLKPSDDWDDSIIALLNYPEVLQLMNGDLDWTWKLGEAVLVQQEEVIAAVGEFRERARVAGNLESDEHQNVEVVDDGSIEITPADPEVIYVPYYEPARVTVYQDYPVYHYYPRGYPVYYYPYPADYRFSSGFFWGVTSAFSIGWSTHHLHQHHYGYASHPYYGRRYYDYHYYRRPHLSLSRNHYYSYIERYRRPISRHHGGNYWQPRHRRHGASPRHHNRYNRHPQRRHSDRGDFNRHERQRDLRDGRTRGGSFDGGRSRSRQLVTSGGDDMARPQRRQRRAQLDGMKRHASPTRRAAAGNSRVIANGTSHRNGKPGSRKPERKHQADGRRARPQMQQKARQQARQVARVSQPRARPQTRSQPRQAQPTTRAKPPQRRQAQANPAPRRQAQAKPPQRRQAKANAPQRRQAQVKPAQRRQAKASRPKQSQRKHTQPKQSQPKQHSKPTRVASVQKGSRGSGNRASRSAGNSVTKRSFRSPR